jgi:hypothetical protein
MLGSNSRVTLAEVIAHYVRSARDISDWVHAMRKTVALAITVALFTAAAITLAAKLPKPAAAQQPLDPAIVTTHLLQMRDQEALP